MCSDSLKSRSLFVLRHLHIAYNHITCPACALLHNSAKTEKDYLETTSANSNLKLTRGIMNGNSTVLYIVRTLHCYYLLR